MPGRHRMLFGLAAIAGFIGRDAIAADLVGLVTSLAAVFVSVFLVVLAITAIRGPAPGLPMVGPGPVRSGYPDTPQGNHEALYGNP